MKNFKIGEFVVGDRLNPYIIAEIGVNHEGSMETAKRLIDEAAQSGAHAAKFQTYKADKIASKNSPAYWDLEKEPTKSQHALFKKYDSFEQKDYEELAEYCVQRGVHFLSTPFDLHAVDFLKPLVPAFKIASADITNVPLIRKCSESGKPLIMSVGAATLPEIEFALNTARRAGAKDIALLHCVLNYPTKEEDANLSAIPDLVRIFPEVVIGYSDHVLPDHTISALEVAMLSGASILEKHFTHDKSLPGNDHYHAMDKDDLARFSSKVSMYRTLSGEKGNDYLNSQSMARMHARRSIVAHGLIKAGDVLTEDNLIAKRPGHGISPAYWDLVIGKVALKNIEADSLIFWDMFE